jgi:tight adherence protein B
MSPVVIISIAAFVAAAAFAFAILSMSKEFSKTKAEDRLDALAGTKSPDAEVSRGIMRQDFSSLGTGAVSAFGKVFGGLGGWGTFLEQANSPIDMQTLVLLIVGCGMVGPVFGIVAQLPGPLLPLLAFTTGPLPVIWLIFRRKRRFAKFGKQIPDALGLIARALRSGHSLNAGLHMVAEEMAAPISTEFMRAYEEQNLGVPIESALKGMLKRMPNLDLKFFVTAVSIQRQTGGDLAEIIDKICEVVRERFKILGMVQALTGEGRLSGAVLMALPIGLFIAVYCINRDYVMLLFSNDFGKKMIGFAIVMQIFGAFVIKKIIDIKV